jgi:hypothetical protein
MEQTGVHDRLSSIKGGGWMNRRTIAALTGFAVLLLIGILAWQGARDGMGTADSHAPSSPRDSADLDGETAHKTVRGDNRAVAQDEAASREEASTSRAPAKSATGTDKNPIRVSHKLTGAGRNTRLSVTVANHGATPLVLNKNVSTDAIRALRFFDADGKRVPTIPPSFPLEGTITIAPGESKEFDYNLNIFSPPLKPGDYSIHVSFVSADPIQWTIPESARRD